MKSITTGLAVLALLVVTLLVLASWSAQHAITAEARLDVEQSLITVRDSAHHSVEAWVTEHESTARLAAGSPEVIRAAERLLATAPDRDALLSSSAQKWMREWFPPVREAMRYDGYFVVGPHGLNLASSRDQNVGVENVLGVDHAFLRKVRAGGSAVSPPVESEVPLSDGDGQLRTGLHSMFVGAPIVDESGNVIAAFLFRLRPDEGFSGSLGHGRIGRTGETYAFDRGGHLISRSRFDDQLRRIGLIAEDQEAMLNLTLRDPGVNLLEGGVSDLPAEAQPLTRLVRSAIKGERGVDVIGYRDYRGVPAVGAWLWDPALGLGIATELDVEEAYLTLRTTIWTIAVLTALLIILALGLITIYLVYRQRRLAEAALRETNALFSNLVDGVATEYLVFRYAFDGTVLYSSPAIEWFTGITVEQALGRSWWELFSVGREEQGRIRRFDALTAKGEAPAPYETSYRYPDGAIRTVEVLTRPEFDEDGVPRAILGVFKDVTERHKTEQALKQAATVFQNTDEAIIVADVDRQIIAVNEAFSTITGYRPNEVLGRNPHLQSSGRHDDAFYREIWQAVERDGEWRGEIWNRRKNGEIYPAWENITAIMDDYGQVVNYVALFSDISSIKETEHRLAYLAHHDPLTELPNRLRFTANLEQAIEMAKRHRHRVALMYLDLDAFKPINDSMGHDVGDELLKRVAERLKGSVRAEDTVARLGGDEFAIILSEIKQVEDAAAVATKVLEAVNQPMELNGREVSVSASVGISVFPDDGGVLEELLKAADAAMYRAKELGRGGFKFHPRGPTPRPPEDTAAS